MHAAWLVVHAKCMRCVKIAPIGALSGTSAGHISVPSWPTRRCPPRALQLRQCRSKNERVYAYMLCTCSRCYSSSLFLQLGGPTCVAPRRRRRDIWCEPGQPYYLCKHQFKWVVFGFKVHPPKHLLHAHVAHLVWACGPGFIESIYFEIPGIIRYVVHTWYIPRAVSTYLVYCQLYLH